jgi:fructoselysine-6-P-deglycase FrlB-like protein
VNHDAFRHDLELKPDVLRTQAARLETANPWAFLDGRPSRVVMIGMGSSTYAASVAAARLRSRGVLAVAELASSELLPAWGSDTLVVVISAGGESAETIAALEHLRRVESDAVTVALTNVPGSTIGTGCDHVVELATGPEEGGVACRTYQHTLVLLLALEAHLTGSTTDALVSVVRRSAEACEHLLATEEAWRPAATTLLAGPTGTHLVAPARRLGSAQQGALMLREGPRRAAVPCETGEWAHVEVYLTKNTDYRLLVFSGSSWEPGVLEWTLPRRTTVVSVGAPIEGASLTIRYPHDDVDDVRLLTEVLVVELVASSLWSDQERDGEQEQEISRTP